jgi:hypothetical protein
MASLFAPKPQVIQPQAPPPMPDNNSPQVLEAQRKAAADAAARAGRLSTILTDKSGPAANRGNQDTYSARTLGAGG